MPNFIHRTISRIKFSYLASSYKEHPAAQAALKAISDSVTNNPAQNERIIEDIRRDLLEDHTKMTFEDHGAGLPNQGVDTKESFRTISQACSMSKPLGWCRFLQHCVKHLKANTVLELGTNLGISTLYLASAQSTNGTDKTITLEGNKSSFDFANSQFNKASISHIRPILGVFKDTLEQQAKHHAPIDILFIDGHHDGDATKAYLQLTKPYLREDSIVIFDDIQYSPNMQNAWKDIVSQHDHALAIDLLQVGVMAFSQKTQSHNKNSKIFFPLKSYF